MGGPKWRNSVSAFLNDVRPCLSNEMQSHIRMMLDSKKSWHEILNEFGPKWRVLVSDYLHEVSEEKTISNGTGTGPPFGLLDIHPQLCSGLLDNEAQIELGIKTWTIGESLADGGALSVEWAIGARKLGLSDRQIVSPLFFIDIPNVGLQPFKM